MEGLQMARESKPDLVILDLSMPDLSGFEVLNELKQDPATRPIPVIIYTSQVLDIDERGRLQSAVDIVPKETGSRVTETRFSEAMARAGLQAKLGAVDEARV
jgi:CheY-like chemotaxis protein